MSRQVKALLVWLVLPATAFLAEDYAGLLRRAATDTQAGRYKQAIEEYKAALAIRPKAAEALNNLAVVYYQVGQYSEAFEIASGIWRSHRELPSAALMAGMAAVQLNRPKEAIEPFEALLMADPKNRDALLGLASARVALNDFVAAAEIYRREIAIQVADSQSWYGLAICYERMAEDASRRLSRMPGGAGLSKRLLAEYLRSTGDTKLATEAFGESEANAAAASPEAERQYERARDLADRSRDAFSHFVDLAPDSWQAAVFSGDVERQHGNLAAALKYYEKAAKLQPGNRASLLGMGTVYWEMGDFDRATANLREALLLHPPPAQAIFELANIAVRQHREAEAIPLLKQYLALQPDASAARADLGRAFLHTGRYEEAVVELTNASESDERGDVHYQLSMALRKLGRLSEADAALKKSTEIREFQLRREERLHTNH